MRRRPCLESSRGRSTTYSSRQASACSTCCSSPQSDIRLPSPRDRALHPDHSFRFCASWQVRPRQIPPKRQGAVRPPPRRRRPQALSLDLSPASHQPVHVCLRRRQRKTRAATGRTSSSFFCPIFHSASTGGRFIKQSNPVQGRTLVKFHGLR
jgi:hypothetical protein